MMRSVFLFTVFFLGCAACWSQETSQQSPPNVLWLSTEDIGPHLGCYGDSVAKTPNLDRLAAKGVVYDFAWSNYPVCAPARTTIITGLYASTLAAGHMRCDLPIPDELQMFPKYLREAGYYCTNNAKEDYNLRKRSGVWDQSSRKAHYRNRENAAQPFFAVMNQTCTHESKIRKRPHELRTDPDSIKVPPYHPDTPETRRDWAQYYDNIETMDQWVGDKLEELNQSGLADDTIIVFFGDHGSGMPRHKRYAGHSGMHVPLIVYIPEKLKSHAPPGFQPGTHSRRLVSFVDFAPTMLSLAGITPPEPMQGVAFLGKHNQPSREWVFGFRSRMDERIDSSRAVSDGRYVYVRNYMPHLPHGQFINYQQQTPTTAIWNQMYRDEKLNEVQSYFWGEKDFEELYDLESDPHETVNLAKGLEEDLPASTISVLQKMRQALDDQLASQDVELFPEFQTAYLDAANSAYDLRSSTRNVLQMAKSAADTTSRERVGLDDLLPKLFSSPRSSSEIAERHWASVGVLVRGKQAIRTHRALLRQLLEDSIPTVRINIAETLATYGDIDEQQLALESLVRDADQTQTDYYSAVWALNALDRLGRKVDPFRESIAKLPQLPESMKRGNDYVKRLIEKISRQ